VSLFTLPLFHVFGFIMLVRAVALGETMVLMEKFDFESMLRTVEKFRVNYMPVSPPLVVAFAKSELVEKYDISSLQVLGCGGAPLGKEVAERFAARFANIGIVQVLISQLSINYFYNFFFLLNCMIRHCKFYFILLFFNLEILLQ
jgi:4-coumarate--CoA ligase